MHTFKKLGGHVSDPVESLIYPGGKLIPFLERVNHISFVPTYFFHKTHLDQNLLAQNFSYPFIIKPQGGSQGQGVALINDESELVAYIKSSSVAELIVQEYIRDIAEEFRAIVVGGHGLGRHEK